MYCLILVKAQILELSEKRITGFFKRALNLLCSFKAQ